MDIYGEITPTTEIKADVNVGGGDSYTLPPATSNALGGVKADPKQSGDTQPVRIDSDGKLWTEQGGGISDVQVNGNSVVDGGVANVPIASTSQFGAVKVSGAYGAFVGSDGILKLSGATTAEIEARSGTYKPITASALNTSVTAVLTDGKAPALTDAQKAAAQSWLGVSGGGGSDAWEVILEETLTEEVTSVILPTGNYKAVKIYMLISTAINNAAHVVYVASNSGGTIYGEPRTTVNFVANFTGVLTVGCEVVSPYLWRYTESRTPFFSGGNYVAENVANEHLSLGTQINKPVIDMMSVTTGAGTFKAGTKVLIKAVRA